MAQHLRKTQRTRREFTVEAALALLAGVTVTVTGCGGGSGGSMSRSPTAPTLPGDVSGAISANHGHTAIIRGAQLDAGNTLALTLSTAEGHTHSLTLSQAQVMQIGAGQRVSTTTSIGGSDAHNHVVTFN